MVSHFFIATVFYISVVTELRGIVDVRVEEEKVRYFGKGHQVVLYLDTGLSMGITDACTFGDNR